MLVLIAIVVLAALVLLDLLLTMAVIRRLRNSERGFRPDPGGLELGAPVPRFEVESSDGGLISSESLAGRRTLVAFYSTGCTGCDAQAPEFVAQADRLAASGTQVVPVLMGNGGRDGARRDGLHELLAGAGRLVVDNGAGALMSTFAARATPSYFLVGPDGRIAGKGLSLAECLATTPS